MKYYKRAIEDAVIKADRQFPVLLITGPRQVGKTTLAHHLQKRGQNYVTLDDPILRNLAFEDPALFLQRYSPPVIIDEIQYAPNLLPYIKMKVDEEQKPGMFWLTGSQQFVMMEGITESLAGRAAILTLLGFSSREADERSIRLKPFLPKLELIEERGATGSETSTGEIFKKIWMGMMPALATGRITDHELFYSSYVQTYLERDVRSLSQIGNEHAFIRFLQSCAARTAQMLNLQDLARDIDISINTVKSWISILRASHQIALLQPYHSNITKRLIKTPKLYFLDTGLCSYLTGWNSFETLEKGAMRGAIFETFVYCELVKSWHNMLKTPPLTYYRDRDGREIDFLFEENGRFYPVEAKLSASPDRKWTRHFKALEKFDKPVGEGGVVCLYAQPVPLKENIQCIPAGIL